MMEKFYTNTVRGRFISRPNRFIALVEIDGMEERCHVKNTGRLGELLIPGADVILEKSGKRERKTAYDLVAVYRGEQLVNIDSKLPNAAAYEFVKAGGLGLGFKELKREVFFGDSRFDIYGIDENGRECFIEVKGVTLVTDGTAAFPDAPTERGRKHVYGLIDAVNKGYGAYILFIIQLNGIKRFIPNRKTDPAFADALAAAEKAGVEIRAFECDVTSEYIEAAGEVPVVLNDCNV